MRVPPVTYLLPSNGGYSAVDGPAASIPMPLTRPSAQGQSNGMFTYRAYFNAISSVLSKKGYHQLTGALTKTFQEDICAEDITHIRIFAEKHGSDYHPARVEVSLGEKKAVFVMNVAVTERGWHHLQGEYAVLKMLAQKYGYPYLPKVFFKDDGPSTPDTGNKEEGPLSMFLGEWFTGFHEFHITGGHHMEDRPLVLWDTHSKNHILSADQRFHIYEAAATILTLYYDVHTFEQIYPWHHASGDFVARLDRAKPEVRLITARHYDTLFRPEGHMAPEEALVFFLLNLSLRMRLDRLDGTGPVVWADDDCVAATIQGFIRGLKTKERDGHLHRGVREDFFNRCRSLGHGGIEERCYALVDACNPAAPDIPILQKNLPQHVIAVCSALPA